MYLVNFTPPNSLLMNRFLLFFPLLPNIAFRSRKFSVFTARIRSDNRITNSIQPKEHTIDSLKQLIKPVMNDLQNRRFMINYMKDIEYKSDSALVLLEKYANRNQSERFKARDQAALNLLSWELWDVQRLPTFLQNPGPQS
jgi:hypothetical protein